MFSTSVDNLPLELAVAIFLLTNLVRFRAQSALVSSVCGTQQLQVPFSSIIARPRELDINRVQRRSLQPSLVTVKAP